MNTRSRIASIAKTTGLEGLLSGIDSFALSDLKLKNDLDFPLPINLRLGHLAERIVAELIKASTNYNLLHENLQLMEDKKTIGEIDFILEEVDSKRVIHLELAYKFYLFDPSISADPINNWIGPNRNDSLKEKLDKLKRKQFPLLYHDCTEAALSEISIEEVTQELCMLANLFVPFEYQASFDPNFSKAIQGYYLNFKEFSHLDHTNNVYCLPTKKEWGIDPSENENWTHFESVKQFVDTSMEEKQSRLCWRKHQESYSAFFIVWW